jgi:hypothetical protein
MVANMEINKPINKTVTLTIDRCDHCHYFHLGEVGSSTREHCKFHQRDVKYDTVAHHFPIPDWCEVDKDNEDLKEQIESLKEQLNNTKYQFTPRNFEG